MPKRTHLKEMRWIIMDFKGWLRGMHTPMSRLQACMDKYSFWPQTIVMHEDVSRAY